VSSGLGSAFLWKLQAEKYGPENVTGVFTDVNGEHPDNYRFLAETQYEIGSRLVKITNNGQTIWDVMKKVRFLANSRIDPCSRILKREAIHDWLRANVDPANTVISLGIDWTEIHRFDRAAPRWAADGFTIDAPLCESPYYTKLDAQKWLDDVGIARPKLYDMGFSHANCGGGCVKAGIKQFKHLLAADRRWYVRWWEKGEESVRQHLGRDDIAILRDRRGGKTTPLPLRVLREQIEGEPTLFDDEPEEPGCGVCFLEPEDEPALEVVA
jgi:3'-phosphoadenosine 5'-phosphosulfate sulfotransferase (PAPS reductase)/FAD synthetase